MCVCVCVYLLDVPNGGYWELHQQLQFRLGARGQTAMRASAHVTLTSERKLCFSAKLRRQRCCLAELCLQGILPACMPIHCPRPGARARKKGRERARTSSGFSLRNRSSPQFLRRQLVPPSSSVHVSNAGPRSRDSVLITSDSAL